MARDQRALSRRSFCWTLAGVLVAPGIAIAQASKVRRVGVLEPSMGPSTPDDLTQTEALRQLGWVEGQNLHVERRFANGRLEALQPLAEELVSARVEIIVTGGTPATLAAKRATTTIPIVFRSAGDPVPLGLVASLARPGGNVTGFSQAGLEVTAKRLSVLKELLPGLQRMGVLLQTGNPFDRAARTRFENVCQSLHLVPIVVEIGRAEEIDDAIAQLERQRAQALMLPNNGFWWDHRFEILNAATKHGLPTMTDDPAMVREAGALIAYAYLQVEEDRVRAEFIDRILRGARPADLPVRQPTRFELVMNLKTARALGLTIPKELLLRADEVIQ
jgi:putative ABC transport system substrate-binding protein